MAKTKPHFQEECYLLLLENSLKSIPFNVIVGSIIFAYLLYSKIPLAVSLTWFLLIFFISLVRWINSKLTIQFKDYLKDSQKSEWRFIALTFLMGAIWGSAYFIFVNYATSVETIIVVVLGGMAAGALASLSIYLSAYYAYLLPMFIPGILYNFYLGNVESFVLGTTFLLFLIMLVVTAQTTSSSLRDTLRLTKEKDELINQLGHSLKEIQVLSITDPLTGLFNRRYFDSQLRTEFNQAKHDTYSLNLVFIDIDNFKSINDNYGHPCGDEFLINVAKVLKSSAKLGNDSIFRIGGDEFAAIYTDTSLDEVINKFSHIQDKIKRANYKNVSLSVGIICIPPEYVAKVDYLIGVADKTLYRAKKSGKSQIVYEKMQMDNSV